MSFIVFRRGVVPLCGFALWLLTATAARATMRDALAATRLLSRLTEVHLIRIELPGARDTEPRKFHSVAVTFDGVLWLYTPGLGTRPLGPVPANRKTIPVEISTRLHRLEPALGRIDVTANPLLPATVMQDSLRNACFVGCLLELAELYSRGESIDEAGVIFLSGPEGSPPSLATAFGDVGHSLLVYRSGVRWWLLDPAHAAEPIALRTPQLGAALDPAIVDYARHANYPVDRAHYHRFSAAALDRLATEVTWRNRQPVNTSEFDR